VLIVTVVFCYTDCVGHPRFFLGSDSAPHLISAKSIASPTEGCAAGVYTSPILLPLVAHLLDSFGALDRLQGFVADNGRRFYDLSGTTDPSRSHAVRLRRSKQTITRSLKLDGDEVVPFWADKEINFTIAS
jgi:dihydroorotase